MTLFSYQIQLVGGPDDGATFKTLTLPAFWSVEKRYALTRMTLGFRGDELSDRYWRSDRVTEGGLVLYYHEDCYGNEEVTA